MNKKKLPIIASPMNDLRSPTVNSKQNCRNLTSPPQVSNINSDRESGLRSSCIKHMPLTSRMDSPTFYTPMRREDIAIRNFDYPCEKVQRNHRILTEELQTNDPLILSYQLESILEAKVFSSSLKGSPTKLRLRKLCPNLSLIWGSSSHLTGVMKSKGNLYIQIPLESYSISINGQNLSEESHPLHMIVTHENRLTYFSMKEKFQSIRLSVNYGHFSFLYEQITGLEFDAHLDSNFLTFQSLEQKKSFLDKISPLTKEQLSPSFSRDPEALSEEILKALIKSLSTEHISSTRSYCNTLALRAHEIMIKSSYEKLGIEEMCNKLNASRRSLQQGFKAVYGMGFIEYHKLYRLNKLREHILLNGLDSGGLTFLMGEFGFTHAGRFAKEYKKAFGISPSKEKKQVFEKSIFL